MLSNSRGVTLVELLASTAIMMLFLLLAYSVYAFGAKHYDHQVSRMEQQNNVRYALHVINKDLRMHPDQVEVVGTNQLIIAGIQYHLENHVLLKDALVLSEGIAEFLVTREQNRIVIEIVSLPNAQGKRFSQSSELYLRQ